MDALWERVRAAADEWYDAGYNVMPMRANGQKEPAVKWTKYQTERVPLEVHDRWFHGSVKRHGLAVITGFREIELFEFESKEIKDVYKAAAEAAGLGPLLKRVADGYLERSPRGGYHLFWHCAEVGPNEKLATDPVADPRHPVLIETRGRGGAAILAPSGGGVHPDGGSWVRLFGGIDTIKEVTPEERASLLALAQTFDKAPTRTSYRPKGAKSGGRPGDLFNAAESPDWEALLIEAGWSPHSEGCWTRPEKDPADGLSATLGRVRDRDDHPLLHVFTTSAPPFEAGQNYSKFAFYAMIKHGGDFKAAAAALAAEGYRAKAGGSSSEGPTHAEILLDIVESRYELTWWDEGDGEPFAIERGGPNLAYPLRGRGSFRAALANAFYEAKGQPPSADALTRVIEVLEHRARRAEPRRLWLRVALPEPGQICVDMGDESGRCVAITAAGWEILPRSPVTFRRTKATRALPEPDRDGSLEELWPFTRIKLEHRPLVKAWFVHAYFPDEDHAILRVTGPQDSGKSQTCKRIVAILDPAIASLRGWTSRSRDVRDWVSHVTASWVSGLENISGIDPDLDDALCRSSTGDAVRDRQYHTQAEVYIVAYRRVVLFNDISLGLIKGDLVDRLLEAGMPKLEEKDAVSDDELERRWAVAYPRIVGGLLNFIARTLKELKDVEQPAEGWPRPRGFSRVLEAVDRVEGTDGLTTWREMKSALKADLAQNDLIALCLEAALGGRTEPLEGSATEWLKWLENAYRVLANRERAPSDRLVWPQNPRALSSWFKRNAVVLERVQTAPEAEVLGRRGWGLRGRSVPRVAHAHHSGRVPFRCLQLAAAPQRCTEPLVRRVVATA